jgi:hypothetical protein
MKCIFSVSPRTQRSVRNVLVVVFLALASVFVVTKVSINYLSARISATPPTVRKSDLSIRISSGREPIQPNGRFTLYVDALSFGPDTAPAIITVTVPPGVGFDKALVVSRGLTCTFIGGVKGMIQCTSQLFRVGGASFSLKIPPSMVCDQRSSGLQFEGTIVSQGLQDPFLGNNKMRIPAPCFPPTIKSICQGRPNCVEPPSR